MALSPISPQDLFMQPLAQDSMEEREEYQHHYHLQSMVGETKSYTQTNASHLRHIGTVILAHAQCLIPCQFMNNSGYKTVTKGNWV